MEEDCTGLHDDVVMELIHTPIIKETDALCVLPWFSQHLQFDPFGVHFYTETSIRIFDKKYLKHFFFKKAHLLTFM